MAETTYTFSIKNDFPPGSGSGAVNLPALIQQLDAALDAATITTQRMRVDTGAGPASTGPGSPVDDEDRLDITFADALTTGEKTTLYGDTVNPAGGLIAAHSSAATTPTGHLDTEETRNPVATDDGTLGYAIGNRWLNTSTGQLWECADASTGAARWVMVASRILADYSKVSTKNSTYTTVGAFIFGGTDNWGTPIEVLALCGVEDATSLDVRLFDLTNSTVIAESIGVTGAYPSIAVLGAISNLPTAQAVWEIQVKRNTGSGNQQVSGAGCSVAF